MSKADEFARAMREAIQEHGPDTSFYEYLAARCAKKAYKKHFEIRRGLWTYEAGPGPGMPPVVVLYNNNPYAAGPGVREEETERIRRRFLALGGSRSR